MDPDRGKPRYFDVHARLTHRFSDELAVRASLLRFEDDLEVSESDREEVAEANYIDTYSWLTLDWSPEPTLSSRSYVGRAALESRRNGVAEQEGISSGELADQRESRVLILASDWRWQFTLAARIDFGAEYRRSTGEFRYDDVVDFDLLFDVPGAPAEPSRTRSLNASPRGDHYAAYLGARLENPVGLTADLGLRYDHDSLPGDEGTWSPRVSLVWRPNERLAWRGSWGRTRSPRASRSCRSPTASSTMHAPSTPITRSWACRTSWAQIWLSSSISTTSATVTSGPVTRTCSIRSWSCPS